MPRPPRAPGKNGGVTARRSALAPHAADLDEAGGRRPVPGRLEVDRHERHLVERARERVVDARAPAPVSRVEAEARVGAEECGEKARAELRIAALRREDEFEQLLRRGARRAVGQVLVEPLPQKLKKPLRLAGAPGAFSRVAMARSSAENCSSSTRCRSSNCSSSRRRRSWNCSKARRQRAWNCAKASSTPRTMLRVGTKVPWQCGQEKTTPARK